jgi:hypothetical protein
LHGSGRFSPYLLGPLGLAVLLVAVSLTVSACGLAQSPGLSEPSTSLQGTPTSTIETTGIQSSVPATQAEWASLDAAPQVAGLEAVPKGSAVRVESSSADVVPMRRSALLVPESQSYRLELLPGPGSPIGDFEVFAAGEGYLFIPGNGVVEGGSPHWEQAYGFSGPESLPSDAHWFKRGDSYRATFTMGPGPDGSQIEATYDAEQDPVTGILLWERVSFDRRTEEVTREIVPLASVDAPDAQDVYDYAANDWKKEVDALRKLPYDTVGVDLPELVLSRLEVTAFGDQDRATLDYSLKSQTNPSAVQIELFPYGPETAGLAFAERYDEGSTMVAFKRGDALVRISVTDGKTVGLPTDPFAGLDLSLKRVVAALVPIAQLPDEHFALPASYTRAGATKIQ